MSLQVEVPERIVVRECVGQYVELVVVGNLVEVVVMAEE
jgi:hypothetical protein